MGSFFYLQFLLCRAMPYNFFISNLFYCFICLAALLCRSMIYYLFIPNLFPHLTKGEKGTAFYRPFPLGNPLYLPTTWGYPQDPLCKEVGKLRLSFLCLTAQLKEMLSLRFVILSGKIWVKIL